VGTIQGTRDRTARAAIDAQPIDKYERVYILVHASSPYGSSMMLLYSSLEVQQRVNNQPLFGWYAFPDGFDYVK